MKLARYFHFFKFQYLFSVHVLEEKSSGSFPRKTSCEIFFTKRPSSGSRSSGSKVTKTDFKFAAIKIDYVCITEKLLKQKLLLKHDFSPKFVISTIGSAHSSQTLRINTLSAVFNLKNTYGSPIFTNLQGDEKRDGLHTVVTPVHIVPHEEIF